jgi:hypothetical protein
MVYDSEKKLLSLTICAFIIVFGLLCATIQEKVTQQSDAYRHSLPCAKEVLNQL